MAEKIPTLKQAKQAEAKGEDPLTGAKRQRAEAIEKEKEKIAKKAEHSAEQAKSKEAKLPLSFLPWSPSSYALSSASVSSRSRRASLRAL